MEPRSSKESICEVPGIEAATRSGEQTEHSDAQKSLRANNIIKVAVKKKQGTVTFYMYLAKKVLCDFDEIELHALGNAMNLAVMTAESLVRNKYATIDIVKTDTVYIKGRNGFDLPRAKTIIYMKKAESFGDAMKDYEGKQKIRKREKFRKSHEQGQEGSSHDAEPESVELVNDGGKNDQQIH